MGTRSSGHVGLCLALLAAGLYVVASYGYALWAAPVATSGSASQRWALFLLVLVVLTGGFGVASGIGLWIRSSNGRRLGFAFVSTWILAEAVAIWGWVEGPPIAPLVVRDPMAPVLRLWVALSVGLYLWGWAGGYVDRPNPADTED